MLLNAVVLKCKSYSRPPANRVPASRRRCRLGAASGGAVSAIGLPSAKVISIRARLDPKASRIRCLTRSGS